MNKTIKLIKNNFLEIVVYLLIFDLILGGAGRVITIGPVSIRIIIFFVAFMYQLFAETYKTIEIRKLPPSLNVRITSLLGIFFIIQAIAVYLGVINDNNSFSTVVGEFFGYVPILLYPLFFNFSYKNKKMFFFISFIESLILVQSFIILSIVAYGILSGKESYLIISYWLDKLNYGIYDFVGNSAIPRVFTKGAIFIPMAIIYEFSSLIYYHKKVKKNIVFLVINSIALVFTFTTSFFAVTLMGIIFVTIVYRKKKNTYKLLGILTAIGLPLLVYFNFFKLFMSRFSGEYNFSMKFIQNSILFNEIIKKPFLGHGHAKSLLIDYGYEQRNQFHYENAFLQLGLNSGFLGMIAFLSVIVYLLHKQIKLLSVYDSNPELLLLIFSLSSVFFINFTNPFMNNYIGATVLAINIGISEGLTWKTNYTLLQ